MNNDIFPISNLSNVSKCSKDSNKFLHCMTNSMTQIDVIHKPKCNVYLESFLKCLKKSTLVKT